MTIETEFHRRQLKGGVMPRLDRGIHAIFPQMTILRVSALHVLMDPRVKPGGDTGFYDAATCPSYKRHSLRRLLAFGGDVVARHHPIDQTVERSPIRFAIRMIADDERRTRIELL